MEKNFEKGSLVVVEKDIIEGQDIDTGKHPKGYVHAKTHDVGRVFSVAVDEDKKQTQYVIVDFFNSGSQVPVHANFLTVSVQERYYPPMLKASVGDEVRAVRIVTEDGYPEGADDSLPFINPETKRTNGKYIHAKEGELGVVEHVQYPDFHPTVRFDRTGTATVVTADEVVLTGTYRVVPTTLTFNGLRYNINRFLYNRIMQMMRAEKEHFKMKLCIIRGELGDRKLILPHNVPSDRYVGDLEIDNTIEFDK